MQQNGNAMKHKERFQAAINYKPFDRVPCWYFGVWDETLARWKQEGLQGGLHDIPAETGLDPDFEQRLFPDQGVRNIYPIGDLEEQVLEETDQYKVIRNAIGGVEKIGKHGSSIHEHIEPALKPTQKDWERFKTYLVSDDPRRWVPGHEERLKEINNRDGVLTFLGGSMYGMLRDWMGVVDLSMLAYDDPKLFQEMTHWLGDYFIEVNRPLLEKASFDFTYIWEDCCFNTGPLISPSLMREFMLEPYQRLVEFYRSMGVPQVLLDSDGKIDDLIPVWLDAGIDIFFPIEVGTWKASPVELRKRFGKPLKMIGGVNKHVIPLGAAAVRAELEPLIPLVEEGGFIPVPDHRIPPDTSFEQFKTYVRVFRETFG